MPGVEQFRRWAEQAPDGFEFAPKLPGHRHGALEAFAAGARALGDRLGPVRVSLKSARDEGALELLLGSLPAGVRVAFDLEHPSWDGIEDRLAAAGAVRVNDLEHGASFRYLRRRDAPDEAFAAAIRLCAEPAYVYFRHDDAPDAPARAQQLLAMLAPLS
jgi:uncharacterized protein YecE (DUF72 family)